MKIYTLLLGLIMLSATQSICLGQTRYVATTGSDASNDCQLPGSPCLTIGYAVQQAMNGDSILVSPGNYSVASTILVDKSLKIEAAQANSKPVITSTVADVIRINAADVSIKNLRLEMGLTTTTGMRGVVSNQNFDGLVLEGNELISTNTASGVNQSMIWQAFGIHLSHPVNVVYNVSILDNTISALPGNNIFGRGIYTGDGANGYNTPGGVIEGNDVEAYYTLQMQRFGSQINIANNTLKGIALLNFPMAGGDVSFNNNTISGANATTPEYLYTLVELRSFELATINVTGNTFENFENIGLLVENSNLVTVNANEFNPLSSAQSFISLMANSKQMTSGVQATTYSDAISILGNTFNAGTPGFGTALYFADHYGAITPSFSSITIGGTAADDKNYFSGDLAKFITLDANEGLSNTFPLFANYAVTTMKPFNVDITAKLTENNYDLSDLTQLEDRFDHQLDDARLGLITYRNIDGNRFVTTTGIDAGNDCADENYPCLTIAHALTVTQDLEAVIIAPGTYTETQVMKINSNGTSVSAQVASDKPIITTTQATLFDVNATDVVIENLQFEMGLTATTGMVGIESTSGVFNKLMVKNNVMNATGVLGVQPWTWNSFGVRLFSQGTNMDTVTIMDNVIGSFENEGLSTFGRGIYLGSGSANGASGEIIGNDISAFYGLQSVLNTGDLIVNNNNFNGGIMVNAPKQDVNVKITNNRFDGLNEDIAAFFYALVDLRAIELGTVDFQNNELKNYSTIGVLSMASKNVEVINNSFTPFATAENFTSIMGNSKLMTSGTQGDTYGNEIVIKGNTFNPGAPQKGTAITFADHYGATEPSFSSITVGGTAANEKNYFSSSLGNYFVLDNQTGASTTFPLWAGYAATTMKPFTVTFDALYIHNTYNFDLIEEVEAKIIDKLDESILGKVVLGENPLAIEGASSNEFVVYPNPTSSSINIQAVNGIATSVQLTDVIGNVIIDLPFENNMQISLDHLSAGAYTLQIVSNNAVQIKRVIKK